MRIFDVSMPVPAELQRSVIAIGNFDGVHKGHRQLLDMVKMEAKTRGRPAGVLTFEPHPRQIFQPDLSPFRLTPHDVKADVLSSVGVDVMFVLPFNAGTAASTAQNFMDHILRQHMDVAHITVGEDFHFGNKRGGSPATLKENGFTCAVAPPFRDEGGDIYSSSRVRDLIRANHFSQANHLLGWEWYIQGTVQKGDQRGREMGYPTANVALGETFHLPYGVYATLVQIEKNGPWHKAATNIGIRPMFEAKEALVEAHILDFNGDLYGKAIRIKPVRKIRHEMKFNSLAELITQIGADCDAIRAVLDAPHLA